MLRIWICPLAAAGACAEAEKAPAASSVAERRNGKRRLDGMSHSGCGRLRCSCLCDGLGPKPPKQVIADAEGVGHDRQRGIDGGTRREKAAVDDVEVFDFVRLAIYVQCRCFRIVTEANRTVLVRDTGERDTVAEEEVPRE